MMLKIKKVFLLHMLIYWICLNTTFPFFSPTNAQQEETTNDHSKLLIELDQYELDHCILIGLCLDKIKNTQLIKKLLTMQSVCEVNSRDLASLIRKYGKKPPVSPVDEKGTKGLIMDGYAIMKGGMNEKGALKVLYENGLILLRLFRDALNAQLTDEERELISGIYQGHQKFLRFLELRISQCTLEEKYDAK